MWKEFKKFITRGNVLDMAVAIIIGLAFVAIINSLVTDIIMPPVGLLIGDVDFSNLFVVIKEGVPAGPYASLADARAAGAVSINYGLFVLTIIVFIIIAIVIFLMVYFINKMRARMEKKEIAEEIPTKKDCPYCQTQIPINATRCPNCTSQL